MGAENAVLQIRGLHKRFDSDLLKKSKNVLQGVDLTVKKGEIYGFLGPNGAGKTTTIKIVTGLIFADNGEITISGLPHTTNGARAKIGFMPETPGFYRHLTGQELMVFYANLLGLENSHIKSRVDELLELVGLEKAKNALVRTYSKGMTQRIALAQAMLNSPELLILDEPLSGLDPIGRGDFRNILLDLRQQGTTIFFSSHIIPDVENISDRVGILLNGQIAAEGEIEDIVSMDATHWEISFTGVDIDTLKVPLESSNVGTDSTFINIKADAKKQAIEEISNRGGDIIRILPIRKSLEDILITKIREEGQ